MPTPPYAKMLLSVNGGGTVTGGQVVPSAALIALSGENTAQWSSQLWQIYSYPAGFTAPAGWSTDANGVIFSTAVTPPSFTLATATLLWGKYMVRLTVNGGTLAQGLVDESTAFQMLSPRGLHDLGFNESLQFGGAREQYNAELRATLRAIEAKLPISQSLLADFVSTTALTAQNTNLTFPVEKGDIWLVEFGGRWSLASGTSGVKVAVNAPTGAVLDGGVWADLGALTTGTSAVIASTALSSAFNTVAATLEPFEGYCRIKMDGTNAGAITLQIAPAAAVAATLKAGAWMRATRVTEV